MSEEILEKYHASKLNETIQTLLAPREAKFALKMLEISMERFWNKTIRWNVFIEKVQTTKSLSSDPYLVRFINDVSSSVHHVFRAQESNTDLWKSQLRNILFGPPASNSYSVVLFPAIEDLLNEIKNIEDMKNDGNHYEQMDDLERQQDKLKVNILLHLNKLSFAFDTASNSLNEKQL